jgi:acyl carrier protein
MHPLSSEAALAALDRLFEKKGPAQAVAMSVDWTQLARSFHGQPPALISDIVRERARLAEGKTASKSGPRLSAQELLAASPDRRHALLLDYVQRSLAQVMALDAPELDPEESLSNLGLDSLMALELQHSLEESLGAKLPIELLMGMPTLKKFVTRVLEIVVSAAPSAEQNSPEDAMRVQTPTSQSGSSPIMEA